MISIDQATQTRIALLRAGFCPIPFVCGEKRPIIRSWQQLVGDIDEACIVGLQEKYPNASGQGVLTGELVRINVEVS